MAAIAAARGPLSRDSAAVRWIILFAVMLGTILEMLDTSIVNVAIPQMMGNLGVTLDQVNWVSTAYIIANVIVLPITGWLSTRFGRRRYLAASMILFTAASLFCGLSTNLNELIFFRVLQGAGGAALLSTAQATLLEIFPEKQQGMVAAIFGIGVMMGPTFGPIIGGYLTDNYSWPWIFFINLPIGILAAVLTLVFLFDSPHQEAKSSSVDFIGIGLLAVGVGCLQTVLERGNREDWFESALICRLAVVAVAGIVLFVWWEMRVAHPAVDLRVLRYRSVSAATIFAGVVGYGLYSSLFMLPVFLQEVRGYTAEQAGIMLLPDGIAVAVAMGFAGRLVYRFPTRNLVAVGAVSFAAGMWLLSKITLDVGTADLVPPLILRGTGIGLMFVPLALASSAGLHGRDLAEASGMFNLTRQLGGSAGIAFLSTVLDRSMARHRAFLVESVTPYSSAAMERIDLLNKGLHLKGIPHPLIHKEAMAVVDMSVTGQAAVMGFADVFRSLAVVMIVSLPLLLLLKRARQSRGESISVH